MIKPIGQYIPDSFYGKKVLVTNSNYYAYNKGDVYFIDDDGRLLKQVGGERHRLYYNGHDAELTVINDEEQLDFNF
jgi:hypothetical protein